MKLHKQLITASSLALLMMPLGQSFAQSNETPREWQARSVSEIAMELEYPNDNQVAYTVQFGDTLSAISQAMEIDLVTLAEVNGIVNPDLIYPGTVLTTTFNANQEAESLAIESPRKGQEDLLTEVDLVNEEVTYQGAQSASSQASAPAPVVAEVDEWVATEVEEDTVPETELQSRVSQVAESSQPLEEELATEDQASEEAIQVSAEEVSEWTTAEEAGETVVGLDQAGQAGQESQPALEDSNPTTDITADQPVLVEPEEPAAVQETSVETPELAQGAVLPTETSEEELVNEETPVEETPVAEEVPSETVEEELPADVEETVDSEVVTDEEVVDNSQAQPADPYANPENAGLSPEVAAYKEEVAAQYGVTSFSTYRPGDPGDHGRGKAVDFMVPESSAQGDAIAEYSINHMDEKGISYVIWKQQIYGDWDRTWTDMEDRGSVTANHYDHVHVSFN